jgi:WD40 repeat protein
VPECLGLAFSPDSRRLAVLCDRHAKNHGGFVWIHEVDGAARPTMLDLEGRPAAVAWQSPRRLALVVTHIGKARDQHCELQEWELHATPSAGSPPALARRQRLGASVSLAQFSPAGNELALAANDSVAICNVRDGQIRRLGEVGDWNGHRTPNYRVGASALAFSPAGATLAAAGNANRTHTRIGFFALRSQIFDFDSDAFDHGPGYGVVKIAFAPDGERLATIVHRWAGSGETLFLWELGRKVE